MSYPNDPLTDHEGSTSQRAVSLDQINAYTYRCSHCQHEDVVPEVVIAGSIASGDCKPGHLPRLACPTCGGPFRALGCGRLRAARSLSARFPFIAMRLQQRVQLILMILFLAICSGWSNTHAFLRLNRIQSAGVKHTESIRATVTRPVATPPPAASPGPVRTPAPPDPSADAPSLDQYRAWMEEARARHPYSDSVDTMWAVMLCESSGDPNATAGSHSGLFQYAWDTWAGDWNPYRDQPMLDPRAQIFATAKAWQDGNQYWWDCYE